MRGRRKKQHPAANHRSQQPLPPLTHSLSPTQLWFSQPHSFLSLFGYKIRSLIIFPTPFFYNGSFLRQQYSLGGRQEEEEKGREMRSWGEGMAGKLAFQMCYAVKNGIAPPALRKDMPFGWLIGDWQAVMFPPHRWGSRLGRVAALFSGNHGTPTRLPILLKRQLAPSLS